MAGLRIAALASAALLAASASAVLAQDDDEACWKLVDSLCGPTSVGECFVSMAQWSAIPDSCLGPVQTAIEMEREANAEQASEAALPAKGRSWGGHLRAGPGQDFKSLGALSEGQPVTILERTDVLFQDLPWFRIRTATAEGFTWGGILCAIDTPLDGVYLVCD